MKLFAFLASTVAVLVALSPATEAQQIKIGYVDLQRALNESDAGKKAKEEFKKKAEKLQGDLKKQKEDLEELKQEFEKKALVMKDEERRNSEVQLQKKLRDFERSYKDSQGELQLKDNELTADILRDLNRIIQEYGKEEGYTLVLENSSSTVLYSASDADLTDKIIELYNSGKGKKE